MTNEMTNEEIEELWHKAIDKLYADGYSHEQVLSSIVLHLSRLSEEPIFALPLPPVSSPTFSRAILSRICLTVYAWTPANREIND